MPQRKLFSGNQLRKVARGFTGRRPPEWPNSATGGHGWSKMEQVNHETLHEVRLLPGCESASHSVFRRRIPRAARWKQQAANVTIVRDDWGIAHVYGKTDADAVFGMMYTQAEDDFNRVETNYINAMGRLAEAEGESQDLSRICA